MRSHRPTGPDIEYGQENCRLCGKTILDPRFAAATIGDAGGGFQAAVYDDIGCMLKDERPGRTTEYYVHDYPSQAWMPAHQVAYVMSDKVESPAAHGLVAYAVSAEASRFILDNGGVTLSFAAVSGEKSPFLHPGAAQPVQLAQLPPVAPPAPAVTLDASTPAAPGSESVATGDATKGASKYQSTCLACHGPTGEGVPNLGMPLKKSPFVIGMSDEQMLEFVKKGRGPGEPGQRGVIPMPPKGGNPALTDADILDVIAHIRAL